MTHTNEINNEITMSYGSAYYLVHKLNFSSALRNAADQNRAIILPTAHGGSSLIPGLIQRSIVLRKSSVSYSLKTEMNNLRSRITMNFLRVKITQYSSHRKIHHI
jgi:hypothetical protein